jgi:glycosyltransferase involved in cell wall biosynthesis
MAREQVSVSVVIPTHQRPQLLRRAVASALAQTRRPMEILIVENGSSAEGWL